MKSILTILLILIPCISTTTLAQTTSKAQQDWEALVGAKNIKKSAYAYVKDDPALPRVLIIGDSISIGYTPYVRTLLEGKANVHRIPQNGSNTRTGLEKLDAWLRGEKWDVIHVNWGLHDLYRKKDDITADRAIAPEQYRKNLTELITRLKTTKAQVIWCMTTPVPEGTVGRVPGDELRYNIIARDIMTKNNIPINELHRYIEPNLSLYQRNANVHFSAKGSKHLAKHVSMHINQTLAKTR